MNKEEAVKFRKSIEKASMLLDDKDALENIYLYPQWELKKDVKVGERYRYIDVLYKCLQAHTTQVDWSPDKTPALWAIVSLDEWPEWVQPTGGQDSYKIGDKVTYKGEHYISLIDNNVWSPEVYPTGWEKKV